MGFLAGLLAAVIGGLTGCVHRRPPEPTDLGNGVILVSMKLKGTFGRSYQASEVDFVRITPKGEFTEDYVPSNLSAVGKDGRRYVYLIDARPGRYGLSLARFGSLRGKFEVFIPTGTARKSETTLAPGGVVYMGHVEMDRVAQDNLRQRHLKPRGSEVLAKLRRTETGRDEKIAAFESAEDALAGTLWSERVERELMALGPSRPPILKGPFWRRKRNRKRVLQEIHPRYKYIDRLGWGSPFKVRGGLEWREPKGRARIALIHLKPGMKGYRPKDEYLRRLKSLAGHEDSGVIEELIFDTRPAYRMRYTSHNYQEGTLLGSEVVVFKTETLVVPRKDGLFLLHYRAKKRHFNRFYGRLRDFRRYLVLEGSFNAPSQ